jgi:hypothetical protein
LPDAYAGREVDDGIDSLKCAGDRVGIADVARNELDVIVEIVRSAPLFAVDLRLQIVEDADMVTTLKECVGEM